MINRQIKGWTRNSEPRVSALYQPNTIWPRLTENMLKLGRNYDLPLPVLQNTLAEIRERFPLEPIVVDPLKKKRRRTYRGIGLTSRPGSADPVYEAAQYYDADGRFVSSAKSLGEAGEEREDSKDAEFERSFTEINSVAPNLAKQIKSMFSRWQVTKVRLMELMPEGVIPPHFDHPYYEQIRLHSVIESNDDVFWEVEGEIFQIPVDGSLYWFDTGKVHSVYNFGTSPRVVLSIHLCPPRPDTESPEHLDFRRRLTQCEL